MSTTIKKGLDPFTKIIIHMNFKKSKKYAQTNTKKS